jgi:hypothetical protein
MRTTSVIATVLGLFFASAIYAQVGNTADGPDAMPDRKNIVRLSLTQPLLFGTRNVVVGYERIVKPYQSFSINAGVTSLPKLVSVDLDSFGITSDSYAYGFNVSADYRFYLQKENKFAAPRGIYIGPYAYYYEVNRENDWDFNTAGGVIKDVASSQKLSIYGAGFQLGYQFVFWKRLALDLVLVGPGLSRYSFEAKVDGDLSLDEKTELAEALRALIEEKYPGIDFVWGDKEVNANGRVNTTSFGYRYLIHVGFLF